MKSREYNNIRNKNSSFYFLRKYPRYCVQCFMGTISLNPDNYLLKVLICPFHRQERESQKGKVIGQDHTPKKSNRVKFESGQCDFRTRALIC